MEADTRKNPAIKRRWLAAVLVLGVAALGGCNPFMLAAFMFPMDRTIPPKCPLTVEGKDSKVLILCYHAGQPPSDPALNQADWNLGWRLNQVLQERFKENKDRVTLVTPNQVRTYKNKDLRWHEKTPQEIGRHFDADYVVTLEIHNLRLFDDQPGARNQGFYKGHAELAITVTDVHKPEGEGEVFADEYVTDYPRSQAIVGVTEVNAPQFRTRLIDFLARDLAQLFTAHPPRDKFGSE
jgi:hypothetical protein